jgi:hypothetical protein
MILQSKNEHKINNKLTTKVRFIWFAHKIVSGYVRKNKNNYRIDSGYITNKLVFR